MGSGVRLCDSSREAIVVRRRDISAVHARLSQEPGEFTPENTFKCFPFCKRVGVFMCMVFYKVSDGLYDVLSAD